MSDIITELDVEELGEIRDVLSALHDERQTARSRKFPLSVTELAAVRDSFQRLTNLIERLNLGLRGPHPSKKEEGPRLDEGCRGRFWPGWAPEVKEGQCPGTAKMFGPDDKCQVCDFRPEGGYAAGFWPHWPVHRTPAPSQPPKEEEGLRCEACASPFTYCAAHGKKAEGSCDACGRLWGNHPLRDGSPFCPWAAAPVEPAKGPRRFLIDGDDDGEIARFLGASDDPPQGITFDTPKPPDAKDDDAARRKALGFRAATSDTPKGGES